MLEFERQAWAAGSVRLVGVDEAGRGPLAGPVVAACVGCEPSVLESAAQTNLSGLTDSKKLSAARREHFFLELQSSPAMRIGIGLAEVEEIDRINILAATHLAMRRALEHLEPPADHALVDGLPVPGLPCASTAIVSGDSLSLLIAAASVIAKVTRDRMMVELDSLYPGYGFAQHKGYGTKLHLEALRRLGPSPSHRRSFSPVSQLELF